ncbi:MAG TPA: hypothetical protein VIM67_05565 [Terriglobus sp.]
MNFLKLFLRGIAVLPSLIQGIESVYGAKTGDQKKSAALEIVSAAVKMADAIANKTIVDADGFSSGLGAIIDGVVACLNASLWAKS